MNLLLKKNRIISLSIFVFSVLIGLYAAVSMYKIITTTAPDFSIYYQTTYDLIQRIDPYRDMHLYTAFNYPIVTNIVYIPFVLLPYKTAQALYILLSIICIPIVAFFSLKIILKKVYWPQVALVSSFMMISFPTKFTLGMGQSNLIALGLLMIGIYLYLHTASNLKIALIISLALILKPVLAIIVLFFMFKKEWRLILYIGIYGLLLFLFAGIVFGFNYYGEYITHILTHVVTKGGGDIYYNQGISGFSARLPIPFETQTLLKYILTLACLILSTLISFSHKVSKKLSCAVWLNTIVLIDPLSWQHHFVLLTFPFLVAFIYSFKLKKRAVLLLIICIAYFLISMNLKTTSQYVLWAFVLVSSHTLYGAIMLYGVLVYVSKKEYEKNR